MTRAGTLCRRSAAALTALGRAPAPDGQPREWEVRRDDGPLGDVRSYIGGPGTHPVGRKPSTEMRGAPRSGLFCPVAAPYGNSLPRRWALPRPPPARMSPGTAHKRSWRAGWQTRQTAGQLSRREEVSLISPVPCHRARPAVLGDRRSLGGGTRSGLAGSSTRKLLDQEIEALAREARSLRPEAKIWIGPSGVCVKAGVSWGGHLGACLAVSMA
jgi:hypothetical protein